MDLTPPPFLDVPTLLESSMPRTRVNWFWYAVGIFLLIVLGATLIARQSVLMGQLVKAASGIVMVGLMAALVACTVVIVRRHRAEQQRLEGISELIQLRRWDQAAGLLTHMLLQPARSPALRSQALIYLAAVLARYHRFDEAIAVQDHLLENELVDAPTAYGLRLGRAMAMLREDHLFDADRAISELRRDGAGEDSAGLTLIEIYRDVKTGHPAEAVAMFKEKLTVLRDGLGHRVADAWALAARAYDLLGQEADARDAFARATLLSPPAELYRRYPEVQKLSDRFAPEPAPAEAG